MDTVAKMFAALEARDAAGVEAVYADDVQVWHNFSNASQNKAENLAVLKGLVSSVAHIEYQIIERQLLSDGRVLQRHILKAGASSGEAVEIPACMLIEVQDEKILRIDEYLDTGQANRLRTLSGRPPLASP